MTKKKWPDDENDLSDEQVFAMWEARVPVRLQFSVSEKEWTGATSPSTGQGGYVFNYYFMVDKAGRLRATMEEREEIKAS